jgi:hypothetical protein
MMDEALVARVRYHIQKANFMGLKDAESTLLLGEAADAIEELCGLCASLSKDYSEAVAKYLESWEKQLKAADTIEALTAENERLRKIVLRYEDELGILDTLPLVDQREAGEGE